MDDELSEAGQLEAVKRDDANLDCLYFQGAGWPDNKVDGPAFAKAMKTNTHVESFEMTDCSQGDDTAVACANMLKSNNTLQMLGLALNNITDVGALALADALKTNTGLEELYVHGNELTNLGAVALLDALDLNSNITTLNVKSEVLACGHVSTDRIISDWIIDGIKRACKGNEDKIRTQLVEENKKNKPKMARCFHRGCFKKKCLSELKLCSGCKQARYCNKECQKADWKRHKRICGLLQMWDVSSHE